MNYICAHSTDRYHYINSYSCIAIIASSAHRSRLFRVTTGLNRPLDFRCILVFTRTTICLINSYFAITHSSVSLRPADSPFIPIILSLLTSLCPATLPLLDPYSQATEPSALSPATPSATSNPAFPPPTFRPPPSSLRPSSSLISISTPR